ncbi:MAG TPA: type II toxin-antitoxin system RelE/ParE family toxin [Candidatus Marinimicrobia bacterium]|nr:type II toxin-antitoxin system RelE/ParE family toxin [Candidatus Neomarinimicrobiota bacterium]
MKSYQIFLSPEAENDLIHLHRYLSERESAEKADQLLDELEEQIRSLENLATRGHFPPELKRVNVLNYLEIHHKNLRIIYEIVADKLYVHAVLDMRRSLQTLLLERLLR